MAFDVSQVGLPAARAGGLTRSQGFGLVFGTGLVMVAADASDGAGVYADIDDTLRAGQIAHLMSRNGSWYDLTLPFIATPEPYLSPWSRLVDLPYVAIGKFLSLFMAPDLALQLAFFVWPPLMLVVFSFLAFTVARRLAGGALPSRSIEAAALVAMVMLMAFAVLEFVPWRIDHHNVQLLCLLAMAAGLCRWDMKGGLVLGAGSAASVAVGLECLPFVAMFYGGLVVSYLLNAPGARAVLVGASLGMAATTLLLAGALLGPAGTLSVQCDAFSAPQIVLMLGLPLVLGAGCIATPASASPLVRALLLAVPLIGMVGLAALLFPACLSGPYAIIDPLSRLYWFDRIWQEHSILYLLWTGEFSTVATLMLVGIALVTALPMVVAKARGGAVHVLVLYAVAAASFVLALLLTRYIRFPAALAPLFLPALAGWYRDAGTSERAKRLIPLGFAAVLVAFIGLVTIFQPVQRRYDAVDYMSFDACEGQDLSVLAGTAPGRILLPLGIALPVIDAMPAGFTVSAIPFHRASPGMKRMYEAFLSSDPAIRRAALAPFDYVAVCRFPLASDPSFAPLYAALSAGKDWPGLVRIAPPVETGFQLFRIDHAALQ